MTDRRRFLQGAAALGLSGLAPPGASASGSPFMLGVASGYPRPDGMVLWTRLVPDPAAENGGMPAASVSVEWEIADDPAMARVVRRGTAVAEAAWAHSVHAEVAGLEPDRWYWYRFRAGGQASPVGRTRTAPAPGAPVEKLRFAFASCQHFEQGHFTAYGPMVADGPDLIVFLGDYIYESSWGPRVRSHGRPEPHTLAEYRLRYALYRVEAPLQVAHAACPWLVTWDDHEVDNDYANDIGEDGVEGEAFLRRRAAAYQAWFEHMPVPPAMAPQGPDARIHTRVPWGRIAEFFVLDDRQYRSPPACPRRGRGGSLTVDADRCPALADPERSLLGRGQESWLLDGLATSKALWKILAQQTLMARRNLKAGPVPRVWTDGWDGYPESRRRLLAGIAERAVEDVVVIGGDVHMFAVADLKPDYEDPASPVVASEFVTTSVTSQGAGQKQMDGWLPANPHLKFLGPQRGYARMDLSPGQARADLRAVSAITEPEAPAKTVASFVVDRGKPGPRRVPEVD
ncbi:MAG: alkaline phosphatase D family protein [Rhodocyclaceae bacterium]|nr:alkaline phosphatase D family protein [Rhodocyclaceae bacterium]